jgi:hypothetical protein
MAVKEKQKENTKTRTNGIETGREERRMDG